MKIDGFFLRWLRPALLPVAGFAFLLAGCGTEDLTASGGIGGTGVTIGEVSDYGSIFVNGVEFDTGRADIMIEGEQVGSGDQAARDNLPIGQRVVVHGESSGGIGTARRVDTFYRVKGAIETVQPMDGQPLRLTVLEQTVYVTQHTNFSVGDSIQDLTQGTVVQVSGPVDDQGAVRAGYIAVIGASGTPSSGIKGRIQGLDSTAKTFRINGLVVSYQNLQPPAGDLADDQAVAVQGSYVPGGPLEAVSIRAFESENFASAEEFCIDGFIAVRGGQWRITGYALQLGSGTVFEGFAPGELAVGMRVQVRGQLQNRVLMAEYVSKVPF